MSLHLLHWATFYLAISGLVGQKTARLRTPLKFLRNTCTANEKFTEDILCEYRPVRNKIGIFSYGLTYKKPVANMLFAVKSYLQASDKSFQSGHINLVQSACSDMLKEDSIFFKLMPVFKDVFRHFLRPCPYSGRSEIKNFTVDYFDDSLMRRLVKTGTYKLELRTIDGDANATIFQVDMIAFYKGNS